MHKTFCDRSDGRECTARIGYLHLTVVHRTNQGEVVAEDEYKPVEMCGQCIDALIEFFGPGLTAPRTTAGGDVPEPVRAYPS